MSSEVKVKVSLQSGIETGLTKVKAQFSQLRNDLKGKLVGLFAFGAVSAEFKSIVDKAFEISNIARRFSVPAQELQRVANAGRETGLQLESVGKGWNFLVKSQQKAVRGNEELRAAFQRLGIPMKEVANLTTDQLFYRIADAVMAAENPQAAYADTLALMGRGAGELFSTLQKGSAVIKQQGDAFGVMADKDLENLHRVHTTVQQGQQQLFLWGGALIGYFQNGIEAISRFAFAFIEVSRLAFESAKETSSMLKALLTGNIQNFDWNGYKTNLANIGRAIVNETKNTIADMSKIGVETKAPVKEGAKPKPVVDVEDTAGEKAHAEKLITLREQLAEIERKHANDQLTIQGKINALIAQRTRLLKEAAGTKDEEQKLQLEIDAAKINDEITASIKERTRYIEEGEREKEREEADAKKQEGVKIAATSLRRIGGQTRGGFAVTGIDDKILREQTKQTKLLDDIKKNTEASKEGLKMR